MLLGGQEDIKYAFQNWLFHQWKKGETQNEQCKLQYKLTLSNIFIAYQNN
jgi:hypothetical protein